MGYHRTMEADALEGAGVVKGPPVLGMGDIGADDFLGLTDQIPESRLLRENWPLNYKVAK